MNELADWWEWADGTARLQLSLGVLTALFSLTATGLMIHIWLLMIVRNRRQQQRLLIAQRIEDELAAWLSADSTNSQLTGRLEQEMSRNPLARPIVVDTLYATGKLLTFEAQSGLREVFRGLQLDQWCLQKLRSGNWHEQAYIVRVLSRFQVHEALPHFRRLMGTRNATLRIEIITALVLFNDFSSVYAVEEANERLSDWDQLLLLERFRALDPEQIPDFSVWLEASRPDWVLFGVRLCRYFNRYDQMESLTDRLNHPDGRVQRAVLEALLFLGAPVDTPRLLDFIRTAQGECLTLSLRLMGFSGDDEAVAALKEYALSAEPEVRLAALQALKESGYNRQKLTEITDDPRYVEHLYDPLNR